MNTTGNKYGGRTKGTPNKLSSKIKDKLSSIISEAIDSLGFRRYDESRKVKTYTAYVTLCYNQTTNRRNSTRTPNVSNRNYRKCK